MSVILSFLYYSFVSGITPGPPNICSLSTAMRKGKQVALRQWRGLFAGYFFVSMMSVFMTWIVIPNLRTENLGGLKKEHLCLVF